MLVGNESIRFKSYRTSRVALRIWIFYFSIFFFCSVVYVYDMTILVVEKEIFTPMYYFFNSVIRRNKEKDEEIFKKITQKFGKNSGSSGGASELAKPLN